MLHKNTILNLLIGIFPLLATAQTSMEAEPIFVQEAEAAFKTGDFHIAADRFQLAADYCEKIGDRKKHVEYRNKSGLSYMYLSRFEDAKKVFDETLLYCAQHKNVMPAEPVLALRVSACDLLLQTGQYALSDSSYLATLEAVKKELGTSHKLIARIYNNLSVSFLERNEFLSARNYLQNALEAYQKAGITDMNQLRATYANLASISIDLYDYDFAMDCLQKLDVWHESLPPTEQSKYFASSLYNAIGRAAFYMEDYEKAARYAQKMTQMDSDIYGLYNKNTIDDFIATSSMLMKDGQWDKAITLIDSGIKSADSLWRQPHETRAYLYINLSTAKEGNGDENGALLALEKAEQESAGIEGAPLLPVIYEKRGTLHEKRGRYEAALEQYRKAEKRLEASREQRPVESAAIYTLNARVLMGQGKYEAALEACQTALGLYGASHTGIDAEGNLTDDNTPLPVDMLQTLTIRSKSLECIAEKQQRVADTTLLQQAFASATAAIRAGRTFHLRYHYGNNENYNWTEINQSAYKLAVYQAFRLYERTGNKKWLNQSFEMADQSKSSLLLERLHHTAAKSFAGVPDSVIEQEKRLGQEIAWLETQVSETAGDIEKQTLYRDKYLFERKRSYEILTRKMELEYPRYYLMKNTHSPISISELQSVLDDQTLFVEYFAMPERKQMLIFTCSRSEALQTTICPLDSATFKQVQQLRVLLQSAYLNRLDKRAQFDSLNMKLYKTFILPIEKRLSSKRNLIIVNDGAMHYLPFELLVKNVQNKPFHQMDFLLRRHSITYQYAAGWLTHASSLATARQTRRPSAATEDEQLLVFAPVFDQASESAQSVDAERRSPGNKRRSTFPLSPLPYSLKEAEGIKTLFGSKHTALYLRSAATESALIRELGKKRQIIHIASHSFADTDQPGFSGIVCAPPDAGNLVEDGILQAGEIYNLDITAELVVLSSCESGVGRLYAGEGLTGLNRAFAYAGVPNIVFSLWKINDKASAELMIEFYKQILAGKSYAAALRGAKLKMLENPATASPNLWGGFLLMGR